MKKKMCWFDIYQIMADFTCIEKWKKCHKLFKKIQSQQLSAVETSIDTAESCVQKYHHNI